MPTLVLAPFDAISMDSNGTKVALQPTLTVTPSKALEAAASVEDDSDAWLEVSDEAAEVAGAWVAAEPEPEEQPVMVPKMAAQVIKAAHVFANNFIIILFPFIERGMGYIIIS